MSDEHTNPPARSPVTQVTQSPSRPVTAVTSGTRIIGTYEIEKLINSGGMGEVYRGRNIHNGEAVAIKIVLPHLANDEMITQLFQKEAKVLGRLFHEAIVRYHVFTNDPEIGRPCIVMEFVEGTSMNEVVKRGPMPLEDVRTLLRRLAGALDKAHTVGVVHRDLSPDNVILEDGQVSHAKIIDFGIAKSSMKGDATLLQGQFAGKFGYVAPEQLGAYGGNVDGRTDIYSLGLMMVAVSQGRVLNMGKSIVEAVRARGSVPDLSGVYPEIRPLLENMLEPNPENRPRSMAQVAYLVDHPDEVPGRAEDDDDGDRTRIISVLPPSDAKTTSRTSPGSVAAAGSAPKGSLPPATAKASVDDLFLGIPENKPAPTRPEPKKSGKGGLIAALLVLAVGGGGAGAYFAGVFDPKPAEAPTATDTQATDAPAGGTAAAGTSDVTADTSTAATGGTGAAIPATGTQTDPPADPAATPPATTGTGTTAGSDQTAPAATGTADTGTAASGAGTADPGATAAAGGTDAPPATTTGTDTPAPPAIDPPPLDARGQQLAWLETYDAGPCVHLAPQPGQGDLVSIEGFGPSVEPFAALLAAYTAAHGVEPDIAVRVVNDPQCPVMDLMNRFRGTEALPAQLLLDSATGVLRSGETVSGRIEGLAGRAVSLFLVNGVGGATNLKPFISRASDGSVSFTFTVNLAAGAGAEPTPQLLLAVITDDPVTKLDAVPNGVTARALVPFIATEIERARQSPIAALRFFRLGP